jgi:hypothetical protein
MAKLIGAMPCLKFLELKTNGIGKSGASELLKAIPLSRSLIGLMIDGNDIPENIFNLIRGKLADRADQNSKSE